MNLQQLRYLVATADEGTMTRAAAALHVAQPALSRAVRALEAEIDVTVFERDGRGVRVTRQGREVVALARRVLADVDRIAALGTSAVLRVCAVTAQAREIASAVVARMVTSGGGRVSLDVVDSAHDVVDNVRAGSAHVGVVDLPAPGDLDAISLGWQEFVLLHPADWALPDPLDVTELKDVPLVSPSEGTWRHRRMVDTLRTAGIEPTISADSNDRDLILSLVQQGVGAWFSYGRQAADAVERGAGLVHLDPPPMREVGIVFSGRLSAAGEAFVAAAREVAGEVLLPVGDPRLADGTWVTDSGALGTVPATTVRRPSPPG